MSQRTERAVAALLPSRAGLPGAMETTPGTAQLNSACAQQAHLCFSAHVCTGRVHTHSCVVHTAAGTLEL